MTLIETVRTQLSDYPRVHRARANLLLHVVAIPLFWLGAGAAIGAFVSISWRFVALAAVLISVSIGLQAVGHAREREKARPFSGFGNFALTSLYGSPPSLSSSFPASCSPAPSAEPGAESDFLRGEAVRFVRLPSPAVSSNQMARPTIDRDARRRRRRQLSTLPAA